MTYLILDSIYRKGNYKGLGFFLIFLLFSIIALSIALLAVSLSADS